MSMSYWLILCLAIVMDVTGLVFLTLYIRLHKRYSAKCLKEWSNGWNQGMEYGELKLFEMIKTHVDLYGEISYSEIQDLIDEDTNIEEA